MPERAVRAFIRVVRAHRQPSPTRPTLLASGIRTSANNPGLAREPAILFRPQWCGIGSAAHRSHPGQEVPSGCRLDLLEPFHVSAVHCIHPIPAQRFRQPLPEFAAESGLFLHLFQFPAPHYSFASRWRFLVGALSRSGPRSASMPPLHLDGDRVNIIDWMVKPVNADQK